MRSKLPQRGWSGVACIFQCAPHTRCYPPLSKNATTSRQLQVTQNLTKKKLVPCDKAVWLTVCAMPEPQQQNRFISNARSGMFPQPSRTPPKTASTNNHHRSPWYSCCNSPIPTPNQPTPQNRQANTPSRTRTRRTHQETQQERKMWVACTGSSARVMASVSQVLMITVANLIITRCNAVPLAPLLYSTTTTTHSITRNPAKVCLCCDSCDSCVALDAHCRLCSGCGVKY